MGDAMCQRIGLARTRACNNQERGVIESRAAMLDGAALVHIQSGQI